MNYFYQDICVYEIIWNSRWLLDKRSNLASFLIHNLSVGCNKSNTTGAISGAGTYFLLRSTWVHPMLFSGVRVDQSL